MSLSCYCGDDYDWYFTLTEVDSVAVSVGSCNGCGARINIGDEVAHVLWYEVDEDGDETESEYLGRICEGCWGIHATLRGLKYCITHDGKGFIKRAHAEYVAMLPVRHIMKPRG